MARKPRLHYPGALYHVILRGNARQDIFHDAEDRYRFYLFMQEGIERFGHRIFAFGLNGVRLDKLQLGRSLARAPGSGLQDRKLMMELQSRLR